MTAGRGRGALLARMLGAACPRPALRAQLHDSGVSSSAGHPLLCTLALAFAPLAGCLPEGDQGFARRGGATPQPRPFRHPACPPRAPQARLQVELASLNYAASRLVRVVDAASGRRTAFGLDGDVEVVSARERGRSGSSAGGWMGLGLGGFRLGPRHQQALQQHGRAQHGVEKRGRGQHRRRPIILKRR